MKRSGATTLWENWNGQSSRNHPMFGAVTKLLFTELLGIKQKGDSCGFESMLISPCIVEGLGRAEGSIETVSGKIAVAYEKTESGIEFRISADPRIEAEFAYKDYRKTFSGELTVKF